MLNEGWLLRIMWQTVFIDLQHVFKSHCVWNLLKPKPKTVALNWVSHRDQRSSRPQRVFCQSLQIELLNFIEPHLVSHDDTTIIIVLKLNKPIDNNNFLCPPPQPFAHTPCSSLFASRRQKFVENDWWKICVCTQLATQQDTHTHADTHSHSHLRPLGHALARR